MSGWVLGIGALYLGALVYAALHARASNRSDHDFLTAGSNLGSLFGCLTVAATLFSTFTLMGMPDLFRSHGVGAWFFLGIADCALAFVALWFESGRLGRRWMSMRRMCRVRSHHSHSYEVVVVAFLP